MRFKGPSSRLKRFLGPAAGIPPVSWPDSSLATESLQQGRPGTDGPRSKERREGFGSSLGPAVERLQEDAPLGTKVGQSGCTVARGPLKKIFLVSCGTDGPSEGDGLSIRPTVQEIQSFKV